MSPLQVWTEVVSRALQGSKLDESFIFIVQYLRDKNTSNIKKLNKIKRLQKTQKQIIRVWEGPSDCCWLFLKFQQSKFFRLKIADPIGEKRSFPIQRKSNSDVNSSEIPAFLLTGKRHSGGARETDCIAACPRSMIWVSEPDASTRCALTRNCRRGRGEERPARCAGFANLSNF